jgi:hypothetical protein
VGAKAQREPGKSVETKASGLEDAVTTDANRDEAMSAEPLDQEWEIDPVLADHFAAEFRPSWAPLSGGPELEIAAAPKAVQAPARELTARPRLRTDPRDEPVTLPGRRMKRRAATLTLLSVLSFLALAYWGVSSTSKPSPHAPIASPTHGATPAHVAETNTTPEPKVEATAVEKTKPAPGSGADQATLAQLAADGTQPTAASATETPAATTPAASAAPSAADEAPAATATGAATTSAAAAPVAVAPVAPVAVAPIAVAPAAVTATAAAATHAAAAPIPATTASAPHTLAAPAVVALAKPTSAAPAPATSAAKSGAATQPEAPTRAATAQPSAAAAVKKPEALHVRNPLLVVRALPEGVVHLWLDGQRMANPFDVRLPRDTKHKIEARAEGYETSSQTVRIESDAKLTFALRRVSPPAPAHPVASGSAPAHGPTSTPVENGSKTADKRHRGVGFQTVSPY